MKLFLLWRQGEDTEEDPDPGLVASNFQSVFAPLFGAPLAVRVVSGSGMNLVVLELPFPGWKPPSFEEDDQTWALAVDYPVNGRRVLRHGGGDGRPFLPALCRALQEQPLRLLKDLSPPFCLIWSSKRTGEVFVQNDGLGQSQLFEFRDGPRWALSNKALAFKALGLSLEPEPESWAVRATLGWFPRELTGYRKIRFLEPATQLRLDERGMQRSRCDVLSDWVHSRGLSRQDCLELARTSLREQIEACLTLCERPEVGLTGGWDSRAVVSSLRAMGADFAATVRGLPGRHDVVIAAELARIAGFELKIRDSGGLPPEDPQACRRCISLALLWQGGYAANHRHKTFLADRPSLRSKTVNITGQHGEIGRRERALFHDAAKLLDAGLTEDQYEDLVLGEILADLPPFTRRSHRDLVRDTIIDAYREADRYGLKGLARLDFFTLYEFTRRKGSAVHSWQPRQLVAPYLNPGFIRAVFDDPTRTETNAFHRYIIAANTPDWAAVPYYEDLQQKSLVERGAGVAGGNGLRPEPPRSWRQPWGRENYNGPLYWQTVGKPLIDEALAQEGFWTEIFDPALVTRHWQANPDIIALLHLLPKVLQQGDPIDKPGPMSPED